MGSIDSNVAASGAWLNDDTYRMRLYLFETPARITYEFKFVNDVLIWNSKLENSLFGPPEQEELTGVPVSR